MKKVLYSASLILIGIVTAFITSANAQIIDQNQPLATAPIAAFYYTGLAQSFKQTAYDIDGAGVFLYPGFGTGGDSITISLYDALPTDGGSLLTSGTVNNAQPGNWVDVFWNDVAVTPNTTYYLVFTSTPDQSMAIAGTTVDTYPNGETYASYDSPTYNPFPQFDYTFRTYAAPEPSALALGGFGATVLLGLRRRK